LRKPITWVRRRGRAVPCARVGCTKAHGIATAETSPSEQKSKRMSPSPRETTRQQRIWPWCRQRCVQRQPPAASRPQLRRRCWQPAAAVRAPPVLPRQMRPTRQRAP
jgi:hypothetical protein